MKKKVRIFRLAIILTLALFGGVLTAYADSNDFYSGTWPTPSNINVQSFSSADAFKDQISASFYSWNSISSKLHISSYRHSDTDEGQEIKVYGEVLPDAYGTTLNYKKVLWWYEPSWTGEWAYSIIKLDTTPITGSDPLIKKTPDFQKAVVIHELGHSIALQHPDHNDPTVTKAIMHTIEYYHGYFTVQQHDKANVIAKWGN